MGHMRRGEANGAASISPATLRARHPALVYRGFRTEHRGESLAVTYDFELEPDIRFAPCITFFGVSKDALARIPEGQLDSILFQLGLAELPSYWKAACPPVVRIEAGSLDPEHCRWWHSLLTDGLTEFYYVNRITPEDVPVTITTRGPKHGLPQRTPPALENRAMVPLGGGKDSVVTLELLRASGETPVPFVLNHIPSADAVLSRAGITTKLHASRTIDSTLLALNRAGYLNGHTPFSATLAFVSVTAATLTGCSSVVLSNERSANEANTTFRGMSVNHQWSKGIEFERAFRSYSAEYLSPAVSYFSLLRPLYEIQIAGLFAETPQYVSVFKSCNRAITSNSWCRTCPKCLFAFAILSPFIDPRELSLAFGGNLFEDENLIASARELVGIDPVKPLECVGTRDESLVAFALAAGRSPKGQLPAVLRHIAANSPLPPDDIRHLAASLFSGWDSEHCIPARTAAVLQERAQNLARRSVQLLDDPGWRRRWSSAAIETGHRV